MSEPVPYCTVDLLERRCSPVAEPQLGSERSLRRSTVVDKLRAHAALRGVRGARLRCRGARRRGR